MTTNIRDPNPYQPKEMVDRLNKLADLAIEADTLRFELKVSFCNHTNSDGSKAWEIKWNSYRECRLCGRFD